MGAFDAEVNYVLRQRQQQAARMDKFLSDPTKADKLSAMITAQLSPSRIKPKLSKFATQTEAYDSTIPENHPFKGFGQELHERLVRAASHPAARRVNPSELADTLAKRMLAEPGRSGIARYEEAAEFKRRADAAWFELGGPDESVKKPLGSLYDAWLEKRRHDEKPETIAANLRKLGKNEEADEILREASPIATPLGAGVQASIGAGIGAVRTKHPLGALVGAAGGVASEVFGRPISKRIEETEWFKSLAGPLTATRSAPSITQAIGQGILLGAVASIGGKKAVTKGLYAAAGATIGAGAATDTGKALVATLAPYAATGVFDNAALKTFFTPKAVAKSLATNPIAKNVVDGADALAAAGKEATNPGLVDRISKKIFSGTPQQFGMNPEVAEGFKYIARSLTAGGREANLNRGIIEKAIQGHLAKSPSLWKAIDDANTMGVIRNAELEAMTPAMRLENQTVIAHQMSRWATKTLQQLDSIGLDEALTHPSQDPTVGLVHAIARQNARKFTNPAKAKKAAEDVAKKVAATDAKKGPATAKAQSTIGRVLKEAEYGAEPHEVLYGTGGKQALDEAHEVLYGAPRRAPSASAARTIDAAAKEAGAKPSVVFDEVTKRADAIEADPVARKVLNATSEPTELGAVSASEVSNPTVPDIVTRKVVAGRKAAKAVDEVVETKATDEEIKAGLKDKGLKVATDEEAKIVERKLSPVGTVKKKKVDGEDVYTEIVETKLGPQEAIYKKGGRLEAVKKVQEAAKTEADFAQYITEMRVYSKLSPEEATGEVGEMLKMFDRGEIKLQELKHRIGQITESQTLGEFDKTGAFVGKKFASEDGMGVWLRQFDPLFEKINSMLASKTFAAVFGGSAATFAMFMDPQSGEMGGKPAEAGIIQGLAKGLAHAKDAGPAAINLLRQLKQAQYLVSHNIPENKFLLAKDEFQVGLRGSEHGGPTAILKNLPGWTKSIKDNLLYRYMSPGMQFELATVAQKGFMNNPATFRGSFQTAEYVNKMLASKIVSNILRDAGIKSARTEVREAYKELAQDGMMKQVEFDWRSTKLKELEKEVTRLQKNAKKYPQDVVEASLQSTQDEIAQHTAKLNDLKDFLPKYHKDWEAITVGLAQKHSSVRTFLAVADNATFDKYPFLRNVKFTPDEQVAVGRFKEQLLHYKERIKGIREETISGDYAPHIFHPDFKPNEFTKMVGDPEKAAAYLRMHRRSFNSRPLMPDIESSMLRYVSDTETRIQNIDFWKIQGWQEVYEKTKNYPVIHNAFKVIRDGLKPVDMTFGNKMAQRYAEFESVFRLMLSPSATLKHLIKQTADLAQRGTAETVEAYPIAGKALIQRAMEANPKLSSALSGMGFKVKSEQDRLILDYFKSVAPAHGVRKFLLDTGMPIHEEIFAKAKGVWGKVQTISGSGINFAEMWDRGLTVSLGNQIAAKSGLTVEQAMYGTYDMILKNNFLSRELNPAWLHNPKIKAMTMFQGTPFKIMERRLVHAVRSGRVVRDLGKEIYDMTRKDFAAGNMNNTRMMLRDLRNLRADVKAGEQAMKANLFLNTLNQEVDFFGTPILNTFVKDIAIVAAATYVGAESGMALYHHFFHFPFLKPGTTHPTLSLNPGLQAVFNGIAAYNKREEGDDEFLTTKIFQKWLGSGWYAAIPDPLKKVHRISKDDIPEIYKGSTYKYLFAIPAKDK